MPASRHATSAQALALCHWCTPHQPLLVQHAEDLWHNPVLTSIIWFSCQLPERAHQAVVCLADKGGGLRHLQELCP